MPICCICLKRNNKWKEKITNKRSNINVQRDMIIFENYKSC